jgi:HSP20 family protein
MSFVWDPFADFYRVERDVRPARGPRAASRYQPSVDVVELDDAFVVHADMPGVKRDELDIQFEEDVLTLSGERKANAPENARARLSERGSGRFVRKFVVPTGVDAEAIEASLTDGVLTVKLPKKAALKPRRIEVKENN